MVNVSGHMKDLVILSPPQKNHKNSPLNSQKQTKIEADQWVSFSEQK